MAKTDAAGKAIALLQQAIAMHNQQRLEEADEIYKKVLLQVPRHPDALHLRALVFHARGRFADAAHFAEAAIAAAPAVANFHNTAGDAWRRAGRPDLAQKYLQQALRLDPALAMAYHNLSLTFHALGQHEQAQQCVQQALQINPAYVEALAHALAMCCQHGDEAAAAQFAAQLRNHPGDRIAAEARGRYHNHLARKYLGEQRHADAASELDAALALYPGFWGNWAVRAELANEALDFANAELYCATAANLAPDNEDARLNVAHFLLEQKRLDEAQSHYAGWLVEHPDSHAARFGLASVHLQRGEFQEGWACYESRWGLRRHGGGTRYTFAPQWTGEACARLLLYAEQGLGDTLQMLRFLPEVVRRCGAVTLLVQAPLQSLARYAAGAESIDIVTALPEPAAFDHVCPLMSLPHVLAAYSKEQLGMRAPYLAVDSQKKAVFDALLSGLPGKKVGLVWQGSAAGVTNRRRPLPLDALAPLLAIPDVTLVSLQHGAPDPVIGSQPIMDWAERTRDFVDLAAAMAALDAVVTVDTGPAHLAGALGVPVYTLVPWLHDWRWEHDGAHTYWYPSMTLVRQTTPGNWGATVDQLARLLHGEAQPAQQAEVHTSEASRRVIGENRFPLIQAECVQGTLVAPLLDPGTTRALLLYGDDVPREADILAAYLGAGDTAVDVGARAGTATMRLVQAVGPEGNVLAFEPHGVLFDCLRETLQRNRASCAVACRQAVGRKPGKASVPKIDAACAIASANRAPVEPVDAVTLDSVQLSACALVRIDAPGQELDVLDGARNLLATLRPVLYFACDRADTLAALSKSLKQRGYRPFRLDLPLYAPANYRACETNLFADATAVRLLALARPEDVPPSAAVAL